MSLLQRFVVLAGLVGLLFYRASSEQLWAVVVDYQLSWYTIGVPLAWGMILGALASLLGLSSIEQWLKPLTYVAISVLTMGLTGAAAVYGAHQTLVLALPPLQLAGMGLGLYFFGYSFARFSAARAKRQHDDEDAR